MNSSQITLYSNKASKEVVDKTGDLVTIETMSGDFRGSMSILKPVIQIKPTLTATVSKIISECNYVYIREFSRYYFVTAINTTANNYIELELSIDVLMSWKTPILAQKVIVSRNEKEFSLYLDDSVLKVYNKPNITVYHFKDGQGNEQGFTSQEFVLAMAGKRGT